MKRYSHEDLLNMVSESFLGRDHTKLKVSFPDDKEAKVFFEKLKKRMELFKRWAEPQSSLGKIKCQCDNEIKTGQTSVMCCNICGKPDEDFWNIGQDEIILCDYCGHLETEHEENCLKSPETKAELLINIHQQLIDEITETNGDESNAISHSLITVNMIKAVLPDGDLMAYYSRVRQILINKLPTDR